MDRPHAGAVYQNPLAYLLGLQGIALLRAFSGAYDREFTLARCGTGATPRIWRRWDTRSSAWTRRMTCSPWSPRDRRGERRVAGEPAAIVWHFQRDPAR